MAGPVLWLDQFCGPAFFVVQFCAGCDLCLCACLCEVVVLSADDLDCILVLFVVWMRHPAQDTAGNWVMPSLVYRWLPVWEFSLINTS